VCARMCVGVREKERRKDFVVLPEHVDTWSRELHQVDILKSKMYSLLIECTAARLEHSLELPEHVDTWSRELHQVDILKSKMYSPFYKM